jgi:hypothetical protein
LEIYGEIAVHNPAFFRQFDDDVPERVS